MSRDSLKHSVRSDIHIHDRPYMMDDQTNTSKLIISACFQVYGIPCNNPILSWNKILLSIFTQMLPNVYVCVQRGNVMSLIETHVVIGSFYLSHIYSKE